MKYLSYLLIFYRLTEEHKNIDLTVKPKITGVPLLMRRQTPKIQ